MRSTRRTRGIIIILFRQVLLIWNTIDQCYLLHQLVVVLILKIYDFKNMVLQHQMELVVLLGFGGYTNTYLNAIEYITIQSTGEAVDFGDCDTEATDKVAVCGSPTRGIIGGGNPATNAIEYITICNFRKCSIFWEI